MQPMLIRYKKYDLHRQLGKLSYILVPLILVTIFLVTKGQYLRMAHILPPAQNIGGLALDVPDIFAFGAFYILALIHKNNTPYHMRYMIATSLLMLGPGIGRTFFIYGEMSFHDGIFYATVLTELIAVGLIIYDIVQQRPYKLYLVTQIVLLVCHLLWQFQMAQWWQVIGSKFANRFFKVIYVRFINQIVK